MKHLHHQAEAFDIGVYFEANGHGTVIFSERALASFKNRAGKSSKQVWAMDLLYSLSQLINQTVGDALSDTLLVEAILAIKEINLEQWDAGFTNLPNKQEKVKVVTMNCLLMGRK